MSLYEYLQLQPVDIRDDGTVSELDVYAEDDIIDLSADDGGTGLIESWVRIEQDMHE